MEDKRQYGDDVLAVDFLPVGRIPTWSLPTWVNVWRRPMNKQLTHIAYERVRQPQSWDHRQWVSRLEAEFRNAWKDFWGAVTDADFKAEYERQLDACRSKRGFPNISL